MFKKSDGDFPQTDPPTSFPRSNPIEPRREGATIGPSISIKGDLSGEEDLVIQGRVEGKVDLKQNNVTIGKNGRVKADIYGKLISVEGEVEGNLHGMDQIIVRTSGNVRGNISAPRVTLEDGGKPVNTRLAPAAKKISATSPPGGDQGPRHGTAVKTETTGTRI